MTAPALLLLRFLARHVQAAAVAAACACALLLPACGRQDPPAPAPHGVAPAAAPAVPAIGNIDRPADRVLADPARVDLAGWVWHRDGIAEVRIMLNERSFSARIGMPRDDVAQVHADKPGVRESGFTFVGDFRPYLTGDDTIRIEAVDRRGGRHVLGRIVIAVPPMRQEWLALGQRHPEWRADPFYVLLATSDVPRGGAEGIDEAYRALQGPTIRVGLRVPILYLRTTRGAAHDWVFDPEFDTELHVRGKRVAEDSLATTIRYAREHRLPVLFTLNGGLWADARADVPEWDLNDHLEADPANCQWTEQGTVPPDDHLKNLPGSEQSPELARSLTLNVYAERVRAYKKRNLQAAARIIADFARESPELFAGVNLDPDLYVNPFYEGREWFDYNPGTVRQFREWLAGSGPYAPDGALAAYRRAQPMSVAEVNALARANWRDWSEVQPPKITPPAWKRLLNRLRNQRENRFWENPWFTPWEQFRRHLVDLHYDELSRWTHEAGIPTERIFSSQGFSAPNPMIDPFPVRIGSPAKNFDTGGMSVEGTKPSHGHIGAIFYGPGTRNEVRMEGRDSLFEVLAQFDDRWGVVEFNTSDFKTPDQVADYRAGYRALRDLFNYDTSFVSPMAWNGSNGQFAGQPGFVSHTAYRNTPLERAMRDFIVLRQGLPRSAALWTFGTSRVAEDDGWTGLSGTTLAPDRGGLAIQGASGRATIASPEHAMPAQRRYRQLAIRVDPLPRPVAVELVAVGEDGRRARIGAARLRGHALEPELVPLDWIDAPTARIELSFGELPAPGRVVLRRLALLP